jgi:hypothetical protein
MASKASPPKFQMMMMDVRKNPDAQANGRRYFWNWKAN